MTTFIVNLRNISKETSKLAQQLSFMKENEVPYEIINFTLDEIIEEVDTFYISFLDLLELSATEKGHSIEGESQDGPVKPDIYGNFWVDPFQYNYAEITYNNFARIDQIRLLGVATDQQKIRFIINDVSNPYSVTTLRLIENIKEINKSPADLALEKLLECKKRNAWTSDLDTIGNIFNNQDLPPYRYSWEQLTKNFFSPRPVYNDGNISEARIQKIRNELNNGPFTKEALEKNLSRIDRVKPKIEEKVAKEIVKKETALDWLNEQLKKVSKATGIEASTNEFGGVDVKVNPSGIVSQFIDKYSFGCIIKEAADCLVPKDISCRDIFANIPPGQFFQRLKTIFPAGDETLTQIESVISDSLLGTEITKLTKNIKDLKAWIEENKLLLKEVIDENEKKNLEDAIKEKEIQIEQLNQRLQEQLESKKEQYGFQDKQLREFSNGGNIATILATIDGENATTVTNAIIAAIDTIVPFEQICSSFTSMFSLASEFPFVNFEGLPLFEVQEPRPLNDPFSGLSFEISDAFIMAVAQGLLSMIEGIVGDLVNCDTLDQFIKDVLDEGISGNDVLDSAANLFGRPAGMLESYMDDNFDKFIDNISSKTSNMFELSNSRGKIPIGIDQEGAREIFDRNNDTAQTLQAIAQAGERTSLQILKLANLSPDLQNAALNSQKNWVIDVTGTKFEVEIGAQVFDLQEIDRYFNNQADENIRRLSDLNKFTPRSLADAAGIDPLDIETAPVQQQQVSDAIMLSTDEKTEVKRELGCIMRNLTSILLPSQVLSLLSGNATEKTKEIAFEILDFCDTNNIRTLFNNKSRFAAMMSNFGRIAGLDRLQDDLRILIDSPEFQKQTFISKCGPFETLEQFREELLAKTLPREKAREVIRSLNRQRVSRFNELADQILGMSNGIMSSGLPIDTNSYLMNAIRAAKNDEELPEDETSQQKNLDPTSTSQQIAKQFMDNSPVIQDMFNIVLDSIFLPIETTIRSDLSSVTEAFSDLEEVIEPLERMIKIDTGFPFGEVEAINPRFKGKIESGLVPITIVGGDNRYAELVDKSLLAEDSILPQGVIDLIKGFSGGTINDDNEDDLKFAKFKVSDPSLNFKETNLLRKKPDDPNTAIRYIISGDEGSLYTKPTIENGLFSKLPPIAERAIKKVVGSSIRRNINSYNLSTRATNTVISFSINGSLVELEENLLNNEKISILSEELKQFMDSTKKTWDIKFSEVIYGDSTVVNYVSLVTTGKTLTSLNGAEDFFINEFEYSKPLTVSDAISQRLFRRYETVNIGRKNVFDDIIIRKLQKFILPSQQGNPNFRSIFKKDFEIDSEEFFSRLMNGFVNTFTDGIRNSKLLRKAVESGEGNNVTYLELLDLSNCNDIMQMNRFRNDIRNIQARIVDETPTLKQLRGEEKRPSKIATATEMVLSNLLAKITCLDFIIKVLPAYDYFGYSQQVVKNDMMINVVCKMYDYELQRLDEARKYKNATRGGFLGSQVSIREFAKDNIVKFYEIKKQDREFREITDEERKKFNRNNFSYPVELRPIVEKHLTDLLEILKIIAGVTDRRALTSTNDFLKFVMDNIPIIEINSLTDEEVNEYSDNNINASLVLQKYIKFGKINKESTAYTQVPDDYKDYLLEVLEDSVMKVSDAEEIINNLYKVLIRKDFYLFQCDDVGATNESLFSEPYSYSLRMVYAKRRNEKIQTDWGENAIIFNEKAYPYDLDYCYKKKAGIVREKGQQIYDVYPILEENIEHNKTELASSFIRTNQENKYNSYLSKLKQLMIEDDKSNLFFSYALPLQEITSVLLLHSSLANNNKKMKYMFEPSKKKVQNMIEYVATVGDARYSNERIRQMIEDQREERNNVGNPAGPLNFDALKLFYRTPIQILKSLAITTDPNIMLTDKIISTVSMLHSFAQLAENTVASLPIHGEDRDQPRDPIKIPKPFLPYNLTSLALLPFPIFGGLIPAIPPLTSYNVASPIGPIFLLLEPLLWDLPYYSQENKESLSERENCEDLDQIEE